MSPLQAAIADFVRLQQVEESIAAATSDDRDLDENPAWIAATDAAQSAFDRMFAMPAESGSQAAAKLAAMASFYDVPGCGCDRDGWGMLVAEVARFSAADALRVAA